MSALKLQLVYLMHDFILTKSNLPVTVWRSQPQNPSVWKVFSHEIKTDPMLDAPGHIILKKNKCFYQTVLISFNLCNSG